MSSAITHPVVETAPKLRDRDGRLPGLALRRRSSEHPMAMFAVIAGCAFGSMAFVPTTGPAFATFSAPMKLNEDARTVARLSHISLGETEIACRGQAWTSESTECMQRIAQDSGIDSSRKVRKLADPEPNKAIPNIF